MSLVDRAWQTGLRLAFPVVRAWWFIRRRPHRGALVAIWVDGAVLLIRSSYRAGWSFPGGGIKAGESPADAAAREVMEEVGLSVVVAEPAMVIEGAWDGRPDTVFFYRVTLEEEPRLRLDHREVVGARFVRPEGLAGMRFTGPVAVYLRPWMAGSRPDVTGEGGQG